MTRRGAPGRAWPRRLAPAAIAAAAGTMAALAAGLLVSPAALSAPGDAGTRPLGHAPQALYIQTNDWRPGANEVRGFMVSPAGRLRAIPGARVRTGGSGLHATTAGKAGPDFPAASMATTPDGRFLYVANGGTDTIAAFRIGRGGALSRVPGSPFPSRGINPANVSTAYGGSVLLVVNRNEDPSRPAFLRGERRATLAAFRIAPDGALRPGGRAPVPGPGLPASAEQVAGQPGVVAVVNLTFDMSALPAPAGAVWHAAPIARSSTNTFSLDRRGRLALLRVRTYTPDAGSGQASGTEDQALMLGMASAVRAPLAYAGLPVENHLAVLRASASGKLSLIARQPSAKDICWVRTSPDGRWIYGAGAQGGAVNGVGTPGFISVMDARGARASAPVQVQQVQVPALGTPFTGADEGTPSVGNPLQRLGVSADGRFVFAQTIRANQTAANTDPAGNAIFTYRVGSDGRIGLASTLQLQDVGVPVDVVPYGMATADVRP